MATQTKVIGPISAYAIAVQEGYTGSKSEWAAEIGNAQANAAIAQEAANRAQSLTESLPADFDDIVGNFAKLYSELTFPVEAGTYCIHEGVMYKANTRIESSETWTSSHWTQVNTGEEMVALKNDVGQIVVTSLADTVKYIYQNKSDEAKAQARTNIRAASADDVNDLKSAMHQELDYELLNPTLNKGNYVNPSGSLSTGANYCYTDPIAITAGEQVNLNVGGGMTTNVACIFTCNQDGSNKVIAVKGGTDAEYSYLAEADGYIGFSFNFTYDYEMKKYGVSALPTLTERVDELSTEVDFTNSVLQKTYTSPDAVASGYGLLESGLSKSYSIYELRKYKVTAGDKVLVMTEKQPEGYAAFIFNVGSNASSLSTTNVVSVQVEPINGEITVPDRATYLIIMALKTDTTSGVYRYNLFSDSDIVNLNEGFKAKANQGLAKINRAADASTLPPILSLLHFSDIHGDGTNLARIVEFREAYKTMINDAICTGDMVRNVFADGMAFWNAVSGAENIMMCIGNHDVAVTGNYGEYNVTIQQAYDQYFAPYIDNWGVTHSGNQTYWYKDYADQKIRLIALDYLLSGDDATAQNTWLQTALSGAKTNGYAVVGIEHTPPTAPRTKIPSTFTCTLNDYGGSFLDPYMQTVQDFIDGGGSFLCWLAGHTHVDYVEYSTEYPEQPFIIVTSAKSGTGWEDGNRIVGDRSQDAFNVVFLDAGSKLVKLVRVGQDRDAQLRHIGTLTLDVSTSPATVVWND